MQVLGVGWFGRRAGAGMRMPSLRARASDIATHSASEASWLADCIRPASWSMPTVSLRAVIVLSSRMKARLTFLPDASGCFSASMARMPGDADTCSSHGVQAPVLGMMTGCEGCAVVSGDRRRRRVL